MTYSENSDNEGRSTLYVKKGSGEPEEVASDSSSQSIGYAYVFDDGTVFYETHDKDSGESMLYRHAAGSSDRIGKGDIEAVFSSSELLFSDGDTLYHSLPGGGRERVTKSFQSVVFAAQDYFSTVQRLSEKHLVVVEKTSSEEYVLSEWIPGKDLVQITKSDQPYISVSKAFDWVAYQKNGAQYLAHKKGGEWEDRIKVASDAYAGRFDADGKYYYYVTEDWEFGRYTLASGDSEVLYDDVGSFLLMDSGNYVVTRDSELYRMTDKKGKLLAEDVASVTETFGGGFYVTKTADAYDIEYFAPGADKGARVVYDADALLYLNGYIRFAPEQTSQDDEPVMPESDPPTDDMATAPTTVPSDEPAYTVAPVDDFSYMTPDAAMLILYSDALVYLGDSSYTAYYTVEQNEQLAESARSGEVSSEQYTILYAFSDGFYYLRMYDQYVYSPHLESAKSYLNEAISL